MAATHCFDSSSLIECWSGRYRRTTLIYADYAPNPHEAKLVEQAFRLPDPQPVAPEVLP